MEYSPMQETSDLYQAKECKLIIKAGSDGKGRRQSGAGVVATHSVSLILAFFRLRDSYKPVSKASFIDETLFAKPEGIVNQTCIVFRLFMS